MNNYIQPGKAINVTMPDNMTKGDGVQVGTALFGVAIDTVSSGVEGVIYTEGLFSLAKTTAQAYAAGARAYWNSTTKKVTTSTGGNLGIGVITSTAGTSDTTCNVLLGMGLPTLA